MDLGPTHYVEKQKQSLEDSMAEIRKIFISEKSCSMAGRRYGGAIYITFTIYDCNAVVETLFWRNIPGYTKMKVRK